MTEARSADAGSSLSEHAVQAYYAGGLSVESIEAVERHADVCASCRAVLSAVAPTPISDRSVITTLVPGMSIAGRYRTVRLIARGGMGEVYEADDLELGERVALKTVGAVRADDSQAIAQLKREVSLARRVTHANVCRIFDFGVGAATGSTDAITFLTMELVPGETLSERLLRGRLELDEVLAIARQIAAALEAAHRGGVVHRDLKPSNVMLAAGPPARAVVTDFGLAREARLEGGARGSGDRFIGTPEYMAPEQVEGLPAGPPADLYAFGLIVFELVTGRRAFIGPTRMATAVLRLTEDAPSPGAFVPDLPPTWARVIERCLARRPEDRFGSAQELGRALAALDREDAAVEVRPSRGRRRWWLGGAVAIAALAVGAFAVTRTTDGPVGSPSATAPGFRRSVAVIGLHDLAPGTDAAWHATAMTELLGHELEASETVRVLPSETVERARRELAIPDRTGLDAATLGRIRQRLGCDWVITGSVIASDSTLRVDLALADARSGETLVTMTETGTPDRLLDIVSRLGTRLRMQLGLPAIPASARDELRAQQPASPEAARLYAEALVHARASDYAGAKARLLRAIELEPEFPLTHALLATILADSGSIEEARRQIALAVEHANGLSREARLKLEASDRALHADWPRAIEIARALYTFYPDELAYGLQLVRFLIRAGRNSETLAMIAELRRLPAPLGEDPRIDEVEASAYAKQGDPKHRLEASERAIGKARQLGARIMVADNQRGAADALVDLGDGVRAEALYREAKQTYDELGDPAALKCALSLADLGRDRGDVVAAQPVYEQAAAYYRKVGNEYELADKLNSLAQIRNELGDPDAALALYDESLAHYRAIGEREGIGNILSNEADISMTRGDVEGAATRYGEAHELFVAVGMRTHELSGLGDLGVVARREGHFAEAREKLTAGIAGLRELGESDQLVIYIAALGELEREQDHLDRARADYEEVFPIAKSTSDVASQLGLATLEAQLQLDAHDPGGAIKTLRAQLDGVQKIPPAWLAAPHAVLARAQLALGDDKGARETAARAVSELGALANDAVTRVAAEVQATTDCPGALSAARATADAAARHQALDSRYEAELSLGRIAQRCGDADATHRLRAMADRASRDGFVRIARLAREVR